MIAIIKINNAVLGTSKTKTKNANTEVKPYINKSRDLVFAIFFLLNNLTIFLPNKQTSQINKIPATVPSVVINPKNTLYALENDASQ